MLGKRVVEDGGGSGSVCWGCGPLTPPKVERRLCFHAKSDQAPRHPTNRAANTPLHCCTPLFLLSPRAYVSSFPTGHSITRVRNGYRRLSPLCYLLVRPSPIPKIPGQGTSKLVAQIPRHTRSCKFCFSFGFTGFSF